MTQNGDNNNVNIFKHVQNDSFQCFNSNNLYIEKDIKENNISQINRKLCSKRNFTKKSRKINTLTYLQIDKVIKILKCKKKYIKHIKKMKYMNNFQNFKKLKKLQKFHNASFELKINKINKNIRRLNKLKKRKNHSINITPVTSIEWLNNSYTFDFINNSIQSTSYPWKNKCDATIRNHLHLHNVIIDKNNKTYFMKNLVENRIVRNIISKQKKCQSLYKNKQNVYFCYKNNFSLLKSSILKFICCIKTLKKMFNAFTNSTYNTKFILFLISYMNKMLIKNKKLKFVKLFLIQTAIEAFRYARIFNQQDSFYPCLQHFRKIKKRLINKYKIGHNKNLLREFFFLFNFIKKELYNSWPYMFKIKN